MSVTTPSFAEKRLMKWIGPVHAFLLRFRQKAQNLFGSSASPCDKTDPTIKTSRYESIWMLLTRRPRPREVGGVRACPKPTPYLCLSFATLDGFVSRTVTFRTPHDRVTTTVSDGWGIRFGGVCERTECAGCETKADSNRNDETEIAQSEIHRSGADEGAETTSRRRCRIDAAARH